MNTKSKASDVVLYVSLLAFISFIVYVLYINQEVFFTAHDRSEFLYGEPFFHTLLSKPFGLMQYVGAWLTLLFHKPGVGTGVMMAVWTLIFCVGVKAFRLRGGAAALMIPPVACLLTSVVDLGYWIYISTIRGYWFSHSVGFLMMLLLLWAARSTPRKWHFLWYLFAFCLYPLLGWFALLFVLCLALSEKLSWRECLALLVLIFTASIWHTQYYSYLKSDDVTLAGFPRFVTPSDTAEHLAIPFWALTIVTVLISLCGKFLTVQDSECKVQGAGIKVKGSRSKIQGYAVPILCAVAGIGFTWSQMYYDRNYIDEMRMVRLAENDNWREVLTMAEESKRPTNTMIFLKNVALMNEGGLLDRAFKLGNDAAAINNPDSLHVTLLDIASPLVYYNYGMINEAIRLNYEMAIQGGFSPFYLKNLSRCALAKGDDELLRRYTALLHQLPFYGNWQPAPVSNAVRALQKSFPDELTGVENSDSYIINSISLWYESDSKVSSEQALFYAMLRCDSRRFWASLRNYVQTHMDEEFPLHAQEAYIMYMDRAPEEKRMILPITQSVYDGYTKFWDTLKGLAKPGVSLESVAEEMREEWGDTYWWYNVFGRKVFIVNRIVGHEVQS